MTSKLTITLTHVENVGHSAGFRLRNNEGWTFEFELNDSAIHDAQHTLPAFVYQRLLDLQTQAGHRFRAALRQREEEQRERDNAPTGQDIEHSHNFDYQEPPSIITTVSGDVWTTLSDQQVEHLMTLRGVRGFRFPELLIRD